MCSYVPMNGTRYHVEVECTVLGEFEVMMRLKQGDTLSPILLNIALECYKLGIIICKTSLDLLCFADDLNSARASK